MRLSAVVIILAVASVAAAADPEARYRFGDKPQWGDATFDDSGWSQTKDLHWPRPPLSGDGFMWVRYRLAVPAADHRTPLALSAGTGGIELPCEIRANGFQVATFGRFPPHDYTPAVPMTTPVDLPMQVVPEGRITMVALRIWYPSYKRLVGGVGGGIVLQIDSRDRLRLLERTAIAEARVANFALIIRAAVYFVLGLCLLGVWRLGRASAELFWFALYLLGTALFAVYDALPQLFRLDVSINVFAIADFTLQWLMFNVLFEFQWAVFAMGRRWVLRLLQATFAAAFVLAASPFLGLPPAPWMAVALTGASVLIVTAEMIRMAIAVWQFGRSSETRGVAAAMVVYTVTLLLSSGVLGRVIPLTFNIGPVTVGTWPVVEFLFVVAVSILLLRRMWRAWRHKQELESEFEAAREMQTALVPRGEIRAIPGFRLDTVYVPALEVGGDFYQFFTHADGSLLVVIGDVSGKGLKAAMTVTAAVAVLREIVEECREPSEVLCRLNRAMSRGRREGFVTCLALRIDLSGIVHAANAGHLAPYVNGREMPVASGLPLGIAPEIDYPEIAFALGDGDRLWLISDGIVEARTAAGELFGFERTAEQIGRSQSAAAVIPSTGLFHQEDDMTVVSIQRAEATLCAA